MRPREIKAGAGKWRALLIVGALISLCLSDNVGTRLLPLPVSEVVAPASAAGPLGIEPAASRAPVPTKGAGQRVEMLSATRIRADANQQQQVSPALHTLRDDFESPILILRESRSFTCSVICSAACDSRPAGRAPPSSG